MLTHSLPQPADLRPLRRRRHPPCCSAGPAQAAVPLALKEWASVCAALGAGDATLLLRKGGVAEKGFSVKAESFALLPTQFHGDAALLQPRCARHAAAAGCAPGDDVPLSLTARVTGLWSTTDSRVLAALAPWHCWTEGLLETRFKWRPGAPVTVLELRVAHCDVAVLPGSPAHGGCTSWVALPGEVGAELGAGELVLSDAAFAEAQRGVRAALAGLGEVTQLPLP